MSLKSCIIILFIYLTYMLGIWLFLSGYLLKRTVISQNSTQILNVGSIIICNDLTSLQSIELKFKEMLHSNLNNDKIPPHNLLKRFNRAIFILIDALRYDFTQFNKNIEDGQTPYVNKMPVFKNIIEKYPQRSFLLKLTADPPTTTLQRLTALTTGSLPTFVDISLSFASSIVSEDNLVRQLNLLNRNVVFMGDDTWETLYPGHFLRSMAFPSFNVRDLHTVDNGILSTIYDEMDKSDWDVIIAHFLGVDHCGHRYGPNHPAMAEKLKQMNSMIQNVTEKLPNDTVLFVIGDHGMTETGDHGGDSHDEVSTALFMYSLSNITISNVGSRELSASQIDIVPTFAMLLGIPIPYSSLGSAITEVFQIPTILKGSPCFYEEIDSLLTTAISLLENSFQVHRYITNYANMSNDMSPLILEKAENILQHNFQLWKSVNNDVNRTKAILLEIIANYKVYLNYVQYELKDVWATFNLEAMLLGAAILSTAVLLNVIIAYSVTISHHSLQFLVIFTAIIAGAYYLSKPYATTALVLLISYVFRSYMKMYIEYVIVFLLCNVTVSSIVVLLLFVSSFSNSYVVYEDSVILFLLQTLLVYKFLRVTLFKLMCSLTHYGEKTKKSKHSNHRINASGFSTFFLMLALLVIVRLSLIFNKCREEQVLCVTSSFLTVALDNLTSASSTYQIARLCLSWFSVLVVVLASVIAANNIVPKKNYTAAMICVNYGVVFTGILICIHWWLSVLPSSVLDRILAGNEVIAARSAVIVCLIMFLTSWSFPLFPEKPWESPTNHVFSGSLCLFIMCFLLPLYLTAGEGLSLSLTLIVVTLVSFLILDSITADNPGSSVHLNVVIWGLLSCHWFYGTGHQPVFSALQWNAAFVLNREVTSYILSGALITMNAYSSHILHGVSLPLLLMWSNPPKNPGKPLFRMVLMYIAFHGMKLLGAVISCFFLRRHLMVWKIFTPKLLFETAGLIITMISTLFGYLFTLRIASCFHKQIRNNVNQLWFMKDE